MGTVFVSTSDFVTSAHLHFDPMVLQLHDMPVQEKHRISYKMLEIPWDRDPVVSSRDSGVFSKSSNFEGQKSDGRVFFGWKKSIKKKQINFQHLTFNFHRFFRFSHIHLLANRFFVMRLRAKGNWLLLEFHSYSYIRYIRMCSMSKPET